MNSKQFKSQILDLKDRMYRFAESILGNSEAANDAVQDLYMKLWEKRFQLAEVQNMKAFAYKSMRNLCLDKLRGQKQFIELSGNLTFDEPDPYEFTESRDLANQIKSYIDKLPELQKSIIRMRDIDGLEINEIAFALSISENAVSVNLSRARQKIREKILNENKK